MEEQNSIEQMTVLMVEPGYEPYEKTIPNTLAAKQELVGGLISAPSRLTRWSASRRNSTRRSFCSACAAMT